MGYLTPDELTCCRETEEWLQAEVSSFKKVMGLTRKPIEYAYSKVPESVREAIASAILNVLTSVREGSTGLVTADSVHQRLGVPGKFEIFQIDVRHLDAVAGDFLRQSKNLCMAEGAATGVAGLPGIVVDVPALYGLLFRMIAQISVCYGYSADQPEERHHMLKVLEIGHHTEPEPKRAGMDELALVQQMIRDDLPIVEVQKFAVEKGLQTMARQLGLALTQRKLAQSVALVGGVVGAGVNRQLAGDVGEVALHAYRRRHLMELAYLRRIGAVGGATRRPPPAPPAPPVEEREPEELALEILEAAPVAAESEPLSSPPDLLEAEVGAGTEAGVEPVPDRPSKEPLPAPPSGGVARVTVAADLVNRALRRIPDYELEYRHGVLLGRAKLLISAVKLIVIPSCTPSHITLTVPFQEIKAEGAPSFLLGKVVSTFWGTIASRVESGVVPRLQRMGFSRDILTLERGKSSKGEYGQLKISLAALNLWLGLKQPRLKPRVTGLEFRAENIEVSAFIEPR